MKMEPPYLYLDLEEFVRVRIGDVPLEELWSDRSVMNLAENMIIKSFTENKFEYNRNNTINSVLAFHLALAVLAASGSSTLVRKFLSTLTSDAILFINNLNEYEINRIINLLKIKMKKEDMYIPWIINNNNIIPKKLIYSINLKKYLLEIASSPDEALSNSYLLHGKVYFDKQGLNKFLVIIIKNKILQKINKYRTIYSDYESVSKILSNLENKIKQKINLELLPDCVRNLIEKGSKTELSDKEIYVIISFLSNTRIDSDALSDIIFKARLADPLKAKIIARALAGIKGYTPYTCEGSLSTVCSPCPPRGLLREYYALLKKISSKYYNY